MSVVGDGVLHFKHDFTNGVKDVLTSEFCGSISIYVNDGKSNIYNATWLPSKITAESTGYIIMCYL